MSIPTSKQIAAHLTKLDGDIADLCGALQALILRVDLIHGRVRELWSHATIVEAPKPKRVDPEAPAKSKRGKKR